jgi:uncharacterized membrane protein
MSMLPSRKVIAAFIGVFLMGAIVGGLVMMDYTDTRLSRFLNHTSNPDAMASRINQKYLNDYQLTLDEQNRTAPFVKEMAQHLYQERRQFGMEVMNTLDEYHQKIAEQLPPEKREAYKKANEERKKRMSSLLLDPTISPQGQK